MTTNGSSPSTFADGNGASNSADPKGTAEMESTSATTESESMQNAALNAVDSPTYDAAEDGPNGATLPSVDGACSLENGATLIWNASIARLLSSQRIS